MSNVEFLRNSSSFFPLRSWCESQPSLSYFWTKTTHLTVASPKMSMTTGTERSTPMNGLSTKSVPPRLASVTRWFRAIDRFRKTDFRRFRCRRHSGPQLPIKRTGRSTERPGPTLSTASEVGRFTTQECQSVTGFDSFHCIGSRDHLELGGNESTGFFTNLSLRPGVSSEPHSTNPNQKIPNDFRKTLVRYSSGSLTARFFGFIDSTELECGQQCIVVVSTTDSCDSPPACMSALPSETFADRSQQT